MLKLLITKYNMNDDNSDTLEPQLRQKKIDFYLSFIICPLKMDLMVVMSFPLFSKGSHKLPKIVLDKG